MLISDFEVVGYHKIYFFSHLPFAGVNVPQTFKNTKKLSRTSVYFCVFKNSQSIFCRVFKRSDLKCNGKNNHKSNYINKFNSKMEVRNVFCLLGSY